MGVHVDHIFTTDYESFNIYFILWPDMVQKHFFLIEYTVEPLHYVHPGAELNGCFIEVAVVVRFQ